MVKTTLQLTVSKLRTYRLSKNQVQQEKLLHDNKTKFSFKNPILWNQMMKKRKSNLNILKVESLHPQMREELVLIKRWWFKKHLLGKLWWMKSIRDKRAQNLKKTQGEKLWNKSFQIDYHLVKNLTRIRILEKMWTQYKSKILTNNS